jgi:hypothetical protein
LKGGFLARLVFLPSVLAIPDEVIEQSFRNASIDGGEVTSRVIFDRGSGLRRPAHFRFAPKADVRS